MMLFKRPPLSNHVGSQPNRRFRILEGTKTFALQFDEFTAFDLKASKVRNLTEAFRCGEILLQMDKKEKTVDWIFSLIAASIFFTYRRHYCRSIRHVIT